jgi:hypothetical protein
LSNPINNTSYLNTIGAKTEKEYIMKPKEPILRFIQHTYKNISDAKASEQTAETDNMSSEYEIIREMFDGMSTGTARIIIEREVSQTIREKFSISPIENKGRYYVAKIVRPDGASIQRLLLDKQTGKIQLVGR